MQETTYAAHAFAFASRFHLAQVADWFAAAPTLQRSKTRVAATWGRDEMAMAFDFGALVFLNVPEAIRTATLEAFSRGLSNEPHAPLREELFVDVGEGSRVQVGFDRAHVPVLTPAVFEVVATVIAQSACLDYYDEDIQGTLDRIHAIASDIARTGRLPRRNHKINSLVAASVASQIEIISSLALLDKPDLTWEDPLADDLHDKLRTTFEIGERYRALEAKITTCREGFSAFLEMMHSRSSFWLEAIVILLIAFEIVMGLATAILRAR